MMIPSNHSRTAELTVPVCVAFYGIVNALRVFGRARKRSFIAALVLPDGESASVYEKAADLFLEWSDGVTDVYNMRERVQHVGGTKGSSTARQALLRAGKRSILLFDGTDLLNDEVRLVADVVKQIEPPSANYFRAAVRRIHKVSISTVDADFLTTVPPLNLQLAFTGQRPFHDILKRLRAILKSEPESDPTPPADTGPTLNDLSGYGDAKTWGLELAKDLRDWQAGLIAWKDIDRGVLLSGPPGSGKTMFASALGRTCGVPVVIGSSARWQAKGHLNDMLAAMQGAFAEAKSKSPCILFVDEIDSFGHRERFSRSNEDYSRQVVNGFLECLDGSEDRDGVVVVGATNYPEEVDPAIKRPSRLGRQIEIRLPNDQDRLAILRHHSGLRMTSEADSLFIRSTRGFSGDEIGQLCRDARRMARRAGRLILESDVLASLPKMEQQTKNDMRAVAVHEVGHAIIAVLVANATLGIITVDSLILSERERQVVGEAEVLKRPGRHTREYYVDGVAILLGGMAAEEVVLGSYSDGSSGMADADLPRATNLATIIEGCLGMGKTLAVERWVDVRSLETMRSRDPWLRDRVDALLREQFERVKGIISANGPMIEHLVGKLLTAGSLAGADLEKIIVQMAHRDRGEDFSAPAL